MSDYLQEFKGTFTSALRWPDLDKLWETLRAQNNGQWFIYAVGEEPPESVSQQNDMDIFITEVDKLLRTEHEEDYCGIVYADDLQNPSMVKIFDPNNLGVSCGFSENPPLPGWVLSLTPPQDLPRAFTPPGNRKRWWQKVFSH